MKKLLFIIAFTLCFSSYAQQQDEELMYMVLENFTYQPKTKKLKFDLVIKNNTDSTLYFIKPKNYFFSNHNDKEAKADEYGLYYSKPYYITISPYKTCEDIETLEATAEAAVDAAEAVVEVEEVVEETVLEATETAEAEEAVIVEKAYETHEDDLLETTEEAAKAVEGVKDAIADYDYNNTKNNKYKLITEIVELPARAYKKYKNIEIEKSYGAFCDDEDYKIMVDYYSSANPIDYYVVEQYNDYLKNNDTQAIDLLFENELKALKKDTITNTENLKNIMKIYNGLINSNSKTYNSNTIESN